jgi:hypothetical protein
MNFRNGVVGFTALAKIKTLRHELSHRCRKRIIPIMVQCDILEDLEILQSHFTNLPKNALLISIILSFVQ